LQYFLHLLCYDGILVVFRCFTTRSLLLTQVMHYCHFVVRDIVHAYTAYHE